MNEMNVEIRDDRLHISGYVNVVERDSKIINTRDGRCVEQIAAGAFARSLSDGHEVRMKHNHRRDIGSTSDGTIITLKEDNVGLYAETVTDDEELRELAAKGELKGWSFGFVKREGSMEERGAAEVPRRHITALDLTEISILSVTPAYNGNSVEMRADEEVRSYEDYEYNIQAHGYNGEIKEIVETARHAEEDNGNVTAITERTITDENGTTTTKEKTETVHKDDKEALKAKVQVFLMKEKIKDLKREQRDMELRYAIRQAKEHQAELEERYNHYHDPHNGRFASAGAAGSGVNYGQGLYYSMGKGKGEIIGASSQLDPYVSLARQNVSDDIKSFSDNELKGYVGYLESKIGDQLQSKQRIEEMQKDLSDWEKNSEKLKKVEELAIKNGYNEFGFFTSDAEIAANDRKYKRAFLEVFTTNEKARYDELERKYSGRTNQLYSSKAIDTGKYKRAADVYSRKLKETNDEIIRRNGHS